MQKMAEMAKEGFKLKQQLIEDAKKSREDKQIKLAELQKEKANWEIQVESLRTVKEAAEKPEQEAKDTHKNAWDEVQAAHNLEKNKAKADETFKELDDNEDGFITMNEIQTHPELDSDGDGVVSEQEAETLLGGVSQVDVANFQEVVWAGIQDKYKSENRQSHVPEKEGTEEDKMPAYDEETQVLIDVAEKAKAVTGWVFLTGVSLYSAGWIQASETFHEALFIFCKGQVCFL